MQEQIKKALSDMISRLEEWLNITIVYLPNLIIAIIVVGLAFFLGRKSNKWLRKPLTKLFKSESIGNLAASITSFVIITLGMLLALGVLNLDTVLKSILAGAGVLGLAVGLALQGTLANTFSGVFLSVKDVINIGDYIETNGFSGTVEEINLRNTTVKEADNNLVIIPNKTVLENPFKNFGLTRQIRTIVTCGVGYESDLEAVKKIAIDAIENRFPADTQRPIEFFYTEFADSSINFTLRFWVKATAKFTILEAKSNAMMVVKKAFDEADINIPFPIRTLQMDTPVITKAKE